MVTSQYQELLHLTALKSAAISAASEVNTVKAESGNEPVLIPEPASSVRELNKALDNLDQYKTLPMRRELPTLLIWPTSLSQATEALANLESVDKAYISSFAADAASETLLSVREDKESRLAFTVVDEQLAVAGLVEPIELDGVKYVRLTEKGMLAARVLMPELPVPTHLLPTQDRILEFRNMVSPRGLGILESVRKLVNGWIKLPRGYEGKPSS